MEYVGILDVPPLRFVLLSICSNVHALCRSPAWTQGCWTACVRRERPTGSRDSRPHRRSCEFGVEPSGGGLYWGSAASVMTILLLGWLSEKTKVIRQFIEGRPVFLYERGTLDRTLMEKHMVDETDLDSAAREYGLASYHDFTTIVLEGDGAVTGVVGPHALKMQKK